MREKAAVRALGGGLALMLAAALPAPAWADSASVSISNVKIQIVDMVPGDTIWPWAVFFSGDSSWMSYTTLAGAYVESPVASQESQGWLGSVQSAMAAMGSSTANAATTPGDFFGPTGPGASALVTAVDGQLAWAYAAVFDGMFLVGPQTQFIVSATVDGIEAVGDGAQANASIEICSGDWCGPAGYSEVLLFGSEGFDAPATLRAEWSNPNSGDTWGTLDVSLAASAMASVSPVPEPGSAALMLAGLLGVGTVCARRRRG